VIKALTDNKMNKVNQIRIFAEINDSTAQWLETASREDIGMALDFGVPIAGRVNSLVQLRAPRVVAPITSELPVRSGQSGEALIEQILNKQFGGVANVSKNPKSGDLTLFIEHRKIVIEVKNYNNNVPTSGVEKFQRDLSTTNACGGVFISLKTPITGVTSSFTIRYEYAETKTVPCAYIVSSDEATITIAVNMISQLISSFNYLFAEMYSRDKLISNVYEIAEHLDDVSKVRNDLQVNIGDITNQLMKTSLGLVTAESKIRTNIDNVRGELFHTHQPDVIPMIAEMESNQYFAKHPQVVKTCVRDIMNCVQETLHRQDINGSVWKLSAKKCVNTLSGISFTFTAACICVNIPRTKAPIETIAKALTMFGKKVSVDDSLCIELDKTTYDWVRDVIQKGV
jgi:hypothetical protein